MQTFIQRLASRSAFGFSLVAMLMALLISPVAYAVDLKMATGGHGRGGRSR